MTTAYGPVAVGRGPARINDPLGSMMRAGRMTTPRFKFEPRRTVKGTATYQGGTTFEFHCPAGHVFVEDVDAGKPRERRLGPGGAAIFARYWARGLNFPCRQCQREAFRVKREAAA